MTPLKNLFLLSAIAIGACTAAEAQQNRRAIMQEKSIVIQKGELGDAPPEIIIQRDHKKMNLDGLTPEQDTRMKEIRTKAAQDIKPLKNLANEKRAHLQTLSESENPKQEEINKTIDEMGALQISIQKRKALAEQDVRKLLTPDQRLQFDRMAKSKKKAGWQKVSR